VIRYLYVVFQLPRRSPHHAGSCAVRPTQEDSATPEALAGSGSRKRAVYTGLPDGEYAFVGGVAERAQSHKVAVLIVDGH
jgi:hypothetical protein